MSFSPSGGMRWTFCGKLLFHSVTHFNRYSLCGKPHGFFGFLVIGYIVIFTTEPFTPD